MKEFNLLSDYPKSQSKRYVSENLRTIKHRIVASYRDKEFYDGDRNYGYGGFKYDGRWEKIAKKITNEYNLDNKSSFLQLGCEKGFFHFLCGDRYFSKLAGLGIFFWYDAYGKNSRY